MKPSPLLALLAICFTSATAAFALTVPVTQDTYTSATGTTRVIYPASGNAVSLPVNSRSSALIAFDLNNPDLVPPAITGSSVTSAILQLYIVRSAPIGDLTIHAVTSTWSEHFTGKSAPAPVIDPTVLATIPAASVGGKDYVTVDLTAAVISALNSGDINGFAIQASGTAKIVLASKEGPRQRLLRPARHRDRLLHLVRSAPQPHHWRRHHRHRPRRYPHRHRSRGDPQLRFPARPPGRHRLPRRHGH